MTDCLRLPWRPHGSRASVTGMELNPQETAVVLIEYQNDFTSDGGALHGAVADVMASTGMLANTAEP